MFFLFWDIDGTLLRTDRASLHAFQHLLKQHYHKDVNLDKIQTAGMTDYHIAGQLLNIVFGREATPVEIQALLSRYEAALPKYLAQRQGKVLPRVKEALMLLYRLPDVKQMLLTGNTAAGARAKLAHYGLDHYFNFSTSAFGDDCSERNCIAAAAQKGIERYYASHLKDGHFFVIGDTPNDITCGKSIGAITIALATGRFTLEQLAEYDADWLLPEMPTPAEFETGLRSLAAKKDR